MTEIRTAIDLRHPPARVWQALTDRRLLAQWFVEVRLLPDGGQRPTGENPTGPGPGRPLVLHTGDLPGFTGPAEVHVIGCRAPQSLMLRWSEPERTGLVECTLAAAADGCRLALRETLESGDWSPAHRRQRQETYQQILTSRLPAALDWLAFREVDLALPAATGGAPAAPARRVTRPWRRPGLVALTAGALLAGAAGVWWIGADGPSVDAGQPSPTGPVVSPTAVGTDRATPTPAARVTSRPAPTRSAANPRPTPRATPTGRSTPVGDGFTARYHTVSARALGFTGEVVLVNDGPGTARNWTVTITLGALGRVTGASGAEFDQQGRTVTFTGAAVPQGRSRSFQFEVTGIDRARSCTVGGTPCTMA